MLPLKKNRYKKFYSNVHKINVASDIRHHVHCFNESILSRVKSLGKTAVKQASTAFRKAVTNLPPENLPFTVLYF